MVKPSDTTSDQGLSRACQLLAAGDGGKKSERNVIAMLNNTLFPQPLVELMAVMNKDTAAVLNDFDDKLVYHWNDYSAAEKQELLALTNEVHDNFLQKKGLRAAGLEFIDEFPESENTDKTTTAEYDDVRHVVTLSRKMLDGNAVEVLTVFQHEQYHGLVKQFRTQGADITSQGATWAAWSKMTSSHGAKESQKIYDKFYDYCAEEALVRSAQVNLADMLAPGSSMAKTVRKEYIEEPGYHRMAASKQFFDIAKNS